MPPARSWSPLWSVHLLPWTDVEHHALRSLTVHGVCNEQRERWISRATDAMSSLEHNPAPGGPGIAPHWTSSAKSGVGTASDERSLVWFTISHGIIDEVYYPRVDQANTRDFGL